MTFKEQIMTGLGMGVGLALFVLAVKLVFSILSLVIFG